MRLKGQQDVVPDGQVSCGRRLFLGPCKASLCEDGTCHGSLNLSVQGWGLLVGKTRPVKRILLGKAGAFEEPLNGFKAGTLPLDTPDPSRWGLPLSPEPPHWLRVAFVHFYHSNRESCCSFDNCRSGCCKQHYFFQRRLGPLGIRRCKYLLGIPGIWSDLPGPVTYCSPLPPTPKV